MAIKASIVSLPSRISDWVACRAALASRCYAGAQADNITATITTPNAAGPLTLNTGDTVVLTPSISVHVSNPDAVALLSTGQRRQD
ncbi:hypothetical protein [Pectobacterium brasiliense]|uniref:hypothetical protein n=1 Tax=Pectobacterium brasiliense TaxID=180957 RepID=UPI001F082320|nr:hypothetical protein [Pectobacterium brasiliense]